MVSRAGRGRSAANRECAAKATRASITIWMVIASQTGWWTTFTNAENEAIADSTTAIRVTSTGGLRERRAKAPTKVAR